MNTETTQAMEIVTRDLNEKLDFSPSGRDRFRWNYFSEFVTCPFPVVCAEK